MNYANAQHAGQTRKATNLAYISHPFGVAGLIIDTRGDVRTKPLVGCCTMSPKIAEAKLD